MPAASASISGARSQCCWSRATQCCIASRRSETKAQIRSRRAHRAKRKKAITTASPLRRGAGHRPARKRALLQHFGSAKAVSRAGVADLESVGGISAQMAQAIYDHFHERG